MKLYLAGPMRDHENFNFPAFWIAAEELRQLGYVVASPAEMDWRKYYVRATYAGEDILQANPVSYLGVERARKCVVTLTDEFDFWVVMREDVGELVKCDAIVMLPGWERSEGTLIELKVAMMLGLPVFEYKEGKLESYQLEGVTNDCKKEIKT